MIASIFFTISKKGYLLNKDSIIKLMLLCEPIENIFKKIFNTNNDHYIAEELLNSSIPNQD
jgi:hypothetical protein